MPTPGTCLECAAKVDTENRGAHEDWHTELERRIADAAAGKQLGVVFRATQTDVDRHRRHLTRSD
jgi:hypothetical protein